MQKILVMKLKFSINYRTEWGQQLVVNISYMSLDGSCRSVRLPMQTSDGELWQAETAVVESRRSPVSSFTYIYKVEDSGENLLRSEWALVPRTYAFDPSKDYLFHDEWHDLPLPFHLYSAAYAATVHTPVGETVSPLRLPLFRKTVLFRVAAPQLTEGQQLAVVGNHPALGSWNPARYLPMDYAGQKEWMLTFNADWVALPLEYKYVVVDKSTHELVCWEEGDNRLVADELADGQVMVLDGSQLRMAEKPWRVAGVAVPVFALRSEHSCGVGDFGDLRRLVGWVAATGMKAIQLLPVNDTSCSHQWGDCHPYNIVSVFALHPHYLDLEQLGELKDKQRMTAFLRQQRELNALAYSDYEAVERVKVAYVAEIFAEQGAKTLASKDYLAWVADNESWLEPYVEWSVPRLSLPAASVADPASLVRYVQYHLHLQLKAAAEEAHQHGIFLKGDLPIGVNADSVETSLHPDFFDLGAHAGTPPDQHAPQGQNWGFPAYHWGEGNRPTADKGKGGRLTIFDWFHSRLRSMSQYFDALRLDHVLGYFRIWQIPSDQLFGTMGYFSPALPLTAGDIEYFGLPFRQDFFTRPFINDRIIDRIFGIHAQFVRENYLTKKAYGLYELHDDVATQRRVRQVFEGRTDEHSLWIRDGLYRLVANVLFLKDPREADMYHPRIHAYREPVFEVLSNEERDAYMRLYNHYFYQRHSQFWGKTGYDRLIQIFANSGLLVCAEDLGQQQECVVPVLDALRILTLELQQLPKQGGEEFSHLDGNPVRSVATISTHDMPPLRLWWEENPDRAQRFYTTMLQKQGRVPEHLPAHLAEEIIARHLYCPSMLCILSLQDWLAMDSELRAKNPRYERINTPADPYNRWQWRMHLTIEQLMEAERFNKKLHTMITRSKR